MGHKILQFDDDEMMRNMYAVVLKRLGFEYIGVEHPANKEPKDLISYILEVKPDLIMMDIIMPVMDGFTAINILKSNQETRNIPIFVFSNLGAREDLKRAYDLGANDYFVSANHTPSTLVQRIRDYLDNPKEYKSILVETLHKLPMFSKFEEKIFKAEETTGGGISTFIFDEVLNNWRSIPFANFVESQMYGHAIDDPNLPKKT